MIEYNLMENTNVLPPRFREKAFRRYEDDLLRALECYPDSILIDPKAYDLSAVTVAQRFRDAKKSLLENNWQTKIPRKRFEACQEDLIVRETMDGMVKVGPSKEATLLEVQHNALAEQFGISKAPSLLREVLDMTDQGMNEIRFLCLLASKRALAVKVKISIDESSVEFLYDQYDINLERQEDGLYILT